MRGNPGTTVASAFTEPEKIPKEKAVLPCGENSFVGPFAHSLLEGAPPASREAARSSHRPHAMFRRARFLIPQPVKGTVGVHLD